MKIMSTADEKNPTAEEALADVESNVVEKHVDAKIVQHAQDADEALKAFSGIEGEVIEIDEATNKRLLRIIDRHMMPLMCVVYGMNYLDSMDYPPPDTVDSRSHSDSYDSRNNTIICKCYGNKERYWPEGR